MRPFKNRRVATLHASSYPAAAMESSKLTFQEILSLVARPGRYIGGEVNSVQKPWASVPLRVCLVFPDLYEIGMSHQGLHILYQEINGLDFALADRCYCPDRDMEEMLQKNGGLLCSLEQKRPLSQFDLVAITLPYELCYSNLFTILHLSRIPFLSSERLSHDSNRFPFILAGGSASVNPEPVAELFDAILIGDGEGAITEICQRLLKAKIETKTGDGDRRGSKVSKGLLKDLEGEIEGIYVPTHFRPIYQAGADRDPNSPFLGLERTTPGPERIKRRILPDLSAISPLKRPVIPNIQIVHDRLGLEIARGCTRGCRFCQASSTYRPVRERPLSQILSAAEEGLRNSGWDELSLLSLSTGDYSALEPLICTLMERYLERNISVSLPSLRVGTLTPAIMEQIRRVRKTGFTLAPEAGSQRLRDVINKDISERDLLDTVSQAFEYGWRNIKLYFMIGLPTETDEDIEAIIDLCRRCLQLAKAAGKGRSAGVTASVGTFVPKPHTPFQWEGQLGLEESRRRISMLKRGLDGKGLKLKWHEPRQSLLEGIFSRGDRRLLSLLMRAWQLGARLDAWSDHLKPEKYFQAAEELGIRLEAYLAQRPLDAPLPWDHIDLGIKKAFLRLERKRALDGRITEDCRHGECQRCGVCDFETIRPVLFSPQAKEGQMPKEGPGLEGEQKEALQRGSGPAWYMVTYTKLGPARFLGHLDLTRAIHKAFRRAALPLSFSKGFHPMPKIAFDQPLPLGMESLEERLVLQLDEPLPPKDVQEMANTQLPPGISICSAMLSMEKLKIGQAGRSRFLCALRGLDRAARNEAIRMFHLAEQVPLVKISKKGKRRQIELKELVNISPIEQEEISDKETRPWVEGLEKELSARFSLVQMDLDLSQGHLSPLPILELLFSLSGEQLRLCRIIKLKT